MAIAVETTSPGLFASLLVSVLVLAWAISRAPWPALAKVAARQHLWMGAVVALAIFWSLVQVTVHPQLQLHPLLITSATVIFGARLALVLGALALAAHYWISGIVWTGLPLSFVAAVVPAVAVTRLLLMGIAQVRKQNLFLYTLGGGFVGGMLSMLMVGASHLAWLWVTDLPNFNLLLNNGYVFFLLMFPEGFCNGTIVSAMAIMAPHLVKTYDDDFYLQKTGD